MEGTEMKALSQQIEHLASILSKAMPDGNREIIRSQYLQLIEMENAK
jgi:hypothetical protein